MNIFHDPQYFPFKNLIEFLYFIMPISVDISKTNYKYNQRDHSSLIFKEYLWFYLSKFIAYFTYTEK